MCTPDEYTLTLQRNIRRDPPTRWGRIKWYDAAKGFGFFVMDGGGKDIVVHASALDRVDAIDLTEGQRVLIDIAEGRKGRVDPTGLVAARPV